MKKIIIAGGTGFLGNAVAEYLENHYDEIVILTRGKSGKAGKTRHVHWDARTAGAWASELEGCEAILNTAGKSINCRFTKKNKELILSSRIDSTKILGECILRCKQAPKLWINCSSAAIYGMSDQPFDENSPSRGSDFMAQVSRQWENTFDSFNVPGMRKAILRISLIFGHEGGIYPVLRGLAAKGLGGKMGNGRQMVSIIHLSDVCRVVEWLISNTTANGPYNIALPQVISNAELMSLLRGQTGVPVGLPAPAWALKIGGFLLQKEPSLLLESHNTPPVKLLKQGFAFKFGTARECIESLG